MRNEERKRKEKKNVRNKPLHVGVMRMNVITHSIDSTISQGSNIVLWDANTQKSSELDMGMKWVAAAEIMLFVANSIMSAENVKTAIEVRIQPWSVF